MSFLKSIFKTKLWLFPIVYLAYYLFDPLSIIHKEPTNPLVIIPHFLLIFVIFVPHFIVAIITSFKKATIWKDFLKWNTHNHWLTVFVSIVMAIYLFLVGTGLNVESNRKHEIQAYKQKILNNSEPFKSCLLHLTTISDGGKIGICERTDLDGFTPPIIKIIVYDSSDQIKNDHYSNDWIDAFFSLPELPSFDGYTPGFDVTPITGHYYKVIIYHKD